MRWAGRFRILKAFGNKLGTARTLTQQFFLKHITTGEGGLITTNSETLYEALCTLRTHGIPENPAELIDRNTGGTAAGIMKCRRWATTIG